MKVIGLDLSLTAPGIAPPGVPPFTVHTDAKTGDKRLCHILDVIEYYLFHTQPELAMVEAVPPYESASGVLERVHGVARERLARYGVPFAYVSPTTAKSFATGSGKADKAEMIAAVAEMSGWMPEDDNQADAWVLRRMGEYGAEMHGGRVSELAFGNVSDAQMQALGSIVWPLSVVHPYGVIPRRAAVVKKCRHKLMCLKNAGGWVHPFDMVRCDKPPT